VQVVGSTRVVHGPVAHNPDGEEPDVSAGQAAAGPTFSEVVVEALSRYARRTAFVLGDRRLSYAQTAALVSQIQQVLAARGVARYGAVAALSPNMPETWMAQIAAYLLGARYTGLHPLGSVGDHAHICRDADVEALIVHPAYADRAAAMLQESPGVRHVLTLGPAEIGEDLLALCQQHAPRSLDPGPAEAEDLAWLTYTGGTTGLPKGVMLSQRAMAAETLSVAAGWSLPDTPRYLAPAPITHAGGLPIVPVLTRGGTVVLHQGFDPEHYLRTVQDERINYGFLVPTMIYALLDAADPHDYDLTSLETIVYGSAPTSPPRLVEALEALGPVLMQGYGQTESLGMATMLRKDEHDPVLRPDLLSSCGRPVHGVTVQALDNDGQVAGPGQVGELCLRSPVVMSGYWKQPELTADALRGGWLRTGDLTVRDDEGFFHLVDRKKDLIISGGFNIYPREIEDVLARDPHVGSVAVVGMPDPKWGEAVVAFVVPREGQPVDEAELIQLVRKRKGPHMTPKRIEVVDALPMTALGKIDKKALRLAPATTAQVS